MSGPTDLESQSQDMRILHLTSDIQNSASASATGQMIMHQANYQGVSPTLAEMGHGALRVSSSGDSGFARISLDKPCTGSFRRLLRDIGTVVSRKNVDVIHAHDITAGFYASMAGIRNSIPTVLTRHALEPSESILRRIMRMAVSQMCARSVCTTSQIVAQAVGEDFSSAKKTVLIPDGVVLGGHSHDSQHRNKAKAALRVPDDALVIMAVGGFNSPDGLLESLIRAISPLTANHKNLKLVLVGDGPARSYLEKLVDALVLKKYVVFAGETDEVKNVLSAADYFVSVPDRGCCLKNTLMAMSCSLPVICCSGNREISGVIGDGDNGLVVGDGDVDALAEVLRRVVTEPRLATSLGDAARQVVEKRFTWEQVHFQYLEVYRGVLRS